MAAQIESAQQAKAAKSDDEKAAEQVQVAAPIPQAGGPFVRYTAVKWAALTHKDVNFDKELVARIDRSGTERKITSQQWSLVGVATSITHVWSIANKYKIPASQFNEAQLNYLLNVDGDFALVDANNNPVSR
jgi:hypothetical protein